MAAILTGRRSRCVVVAVVVVVVVVVVAVIVVVVLPSWDKKSLKNQAKFKKKKKQEKSSLGGFWEGYWGVLGPSWPQDPPRADKNLENQFLGPLLGTSFGSQNLPKIDFLGFQEVLIL